MGNSQYTVNNQTANATLINITDCPTNVQLPGKYNQKENKRVPIIITANDINTLYAPLTRDGRITKYEWDPSLDDKYEICKLLFPQLDNFQIKMFVEKYYLEPIDFFGKVKSDLFNKEMLKCAYSKDFTELVNEMISGQSYAFEKISIELLYEIAEENEKMKSSNLSEEYL